MSLASDGVVAPAVPATVIVSVPPGIVAPVILKSGECFPPASAGVKDPAKIIENKKTVASDIPKIVFEFINQIRRYDLNISYGSPNLKIKKFILKSQHLRIN